MARTIGSYDTCSALSTNERIIVWNGTIFRALWQAFSDHSLTPRPPHLFCVERDDVMAYHFYWLGMPFDTVESYACEQVRLVDLRSSGREEMPNDAESDETGPKSALINRVIERDTRGELSFSTREKEIVSVIKAINCHGWICKISPGKGFNDVVEIGLVNDIASCPLRLLERQSLFLGFATTP